MSGLDPAILTPGDVIRVSYRGRRKHGLWTYEGHDPDYVWVTCHATGLTHVWEREDVAMIDHDASWPTRERSRQ